jgi:hypothetical protein
MLGWLRIAISVIGIVACGTTAVFWVRSYDCADWFAAAAAKTSIGVRSELGRLTLSTTKYKIAPGVRWHVDTRPVRKEPPKFSWEAPLTSAIDQFLHTVEPKSWEIDEPAYESTWGFGVSSIPRAITMPHWFPVLLTASFAAAPWIVNLRRFSLRTLLIATTILAVLLGVNAVANR